MSFNRKIEALKFEPETKIKNPMIPPSSSSN